MYALHHCYSEGVSAAKIVNYKLVFTISEFTLNGMKCIIIFKSMRVCLSGSLFAQTRDMIET